MWKQQEEEQFEIEDMKEEIEEEFNLDLLEAWCANAGVQCCEDCRKNEKVWDLMSSGCDARIETKQWYNMQENICVSAVLKRVTVV